MAEDGLSGAVALRFGGASLGKSWTDKGCLLCGRGLGDLARDARAGLRVVDTGDLAMGGGGGAVVSVDRRRVGVDGREAVLVGVEGREAVRVAGGVTVGFTGDGFTVD